MTDMTAEKKLLVQIENGIREIDRMLAEYGEIGGDCFWSIACKKDDLFIIRQALSQRVPDDRDAEIVRLKCAHSDMAEMYRKEAEEVARLRERVGELEKYNLGLAMESHALRDEIARQRDGGGE